MIRERRNLKCTIFGKVQGVGFRAWVRKNALKKNICGWVINNENGTVELEASGNDFELEDFLYDLKKGSFFSKVKKVEYKYIKFRKLDNFEIVTN
tara:strand:+ start:87 stop:371 length:285 start_codon:yes stop_codon:yes gene_type:complete